MKFEVRKGSFHYPREQEILRDISFSFEGAGILSVLGANGAGKTTLMKCMLGLIPWTGGASYLDGVDIRKIRSREFWRQVGYVPQAKYPSFVYTVGELVVMGRSARLGTFAQPGARDWEKVEESLELVGISHLRDKLCTQISGGEFQLALIARALVTEPSLLVLDEPESNLDFRNQRIVLEVLKELCSQKQLSAVINTHFPEHAVEISRKSLLLMRDGSALYGDTEEILKEENLEAAFGVPVRVRTISLPERDYTCVMALPPDSGRKSAGKEPDRCGKPS